MRFSRLRAAGATAAAVALVGVISTPAYAGTNSAHTYGASSGCPGTASDGWFEHDGDWFNIKDTCSDGFSAVLKVDAYPYQSGGGYDFVVWGTGGAGWTTSETHNVTDGKGVCISAGAGHKSTGEWGGFGSWVCATA